ncbi:ribonuclease inhibitor [Xylanimonas protaetiae]|uniref:Ribonuclease inhibitor n=2 Tax=Xylanimonas protaetiae TaxID=2509457 RepID=A0A4P6FMT3_9MICO|nr:ribonuclease inhibitor [Xylanimonas protaetiae]
MVDLGLVHRTRDGAEYWRTELTEYDVVVAGRRTFHLDGARVDSVATFYDELDRVFMAGEDWRLGPSLDALDDLLRGGFGALHGAGPAAVVWHDYDHSREALGFAATRAHLQGKVDDPQVFDAELFRRRLADLEAGRGRTYLELVLEVFAGHPEVELVLR